MTHILRDKATRLDARVHLTSQRALGVSVHVKARTGSKPLKFRELLCWRNDALTGEATLRDKPPQLEALDQHGAPQILQRGAGDKRRLCITKPGQESPCGL